MKLLIVSFILLGIAPAYTQDTTVVLDFPTSDVRKIDRDTFLIKEQMTVCSCPDSTGVVTDELWYKGYKLDIQLAECSLSCPINVTRLSIVPVGAHDELLVECSDAEGNLKKLYFLRRSTTYTRVKN